VARLAGAAAGVDVNPHMLAIARAAAPGVEWRAADAAELPFPDASFDCVLCQQGLQYFADRPAALREMRRVLAPGGRLGLSVWRAIGRNPGFERFTRALASYAGEDAGAIMRTPFSGPAAAELRQLVRGADLDGVALHIRIAPVRCPSALELLRWQESASPLAGPLGALGADAHDALARGVAAALEPYTDDAGVVFPMETHIVTAARPA
jgi:SAM-dependent methyltransferase